MKSRGFEMLSVFIRDIQNMLSVLSGVAELTDDSRVSAGRRRTYAGFIKKETQRIGHAISCMDDAAKLCGGSAEFSRNQVCIDTVFDDIRILLFERGGTDLNLKMNMRIPSICGDRERLITAFMILLDNLGSCTTAKSISAEISPCEEHISMRLYWQQIDRCHSMALPKQTSPVRNLLDVNPDGFSALGFSYAQFIIEAHQGRIWCIPDSLATVSFLILLPYRS